MIEPLTVASSCSCSTLFEVECVDCSLELLVFLGNFDGECGNVVHYSATRDLLYPVIVSQ